MMKNHATIALLCIAALAAGTGIGSSEAQGQDKPIIRKDASEEEIVRKIKSLDKLAQETESTREQPRRQLAAKELLIYYVKELVTRYPHSDFKAQALIAKLRALAHLARANPARLDELLLITEELSKSRASSELAAENAFYAIQGFTLGARRERMPEQRRLQGTIERYRAFLGDYPKSPHVPVVRASLIRNLIVAGQPTEGMREFPKLQADHPDHPATRRAAGEVNLLRAVGRPFTRVLTTSEGKNIRPADHLGKVLIIHFWEASHKQSIKQLPELIKLYNAQHTGGLEIVGIELGSTPDQAGDAAEKPKIPWLQFSEPKGIDSDIVIDTGIITVPTYFVLDRKGRLRSTDPGEQLLTLVQQLLTE